MKYVLAFFLLMSYQAYADSTVYYCFEEKIKVDGPGTCAARHARVDAAKQGELKVQVLKIKREFVFGDGNDIQFNYDITVKNNTKTYVNTVKLCGVLIEDDKNDNPLEKPYMELSRCAGWADVN